MLASHFSRFRTANPGRLHFAAHSHHPWPDATEHAQAQYWSDGAELADRKWVKVFEEVIPSAQRHVARITGLADSRQVAFAPNTHEFVARIYSCFEEPRPIRVLMGGAEFHSFRRQTRRFQESGRVVAEEIAPEPFGTFAQRFAAAARRGSWDLVWLSHVFFDSAFHIADLETICAAAPPAALVVIDGYHAFCALPVDLSRLHSRIFYIAGGYKYAMSGEGACWLAIPPGCTLRPADTGWYASFDTLSVAPGATVPYAADAFRFWGATFDPSGLYRFNAAMDWLASTGITIEQVHRYSLALQERFLSGLARLGLATLTPARLVLPPGTPRGNFLAFDVDDAEDLHRRITAQNVTIDRRDRRLRFGFGIYHEERDVDRLLEAISRALR